jgi:hypothetical protein
MLSSTTSGSSAPERQSGSKGMRKHVRWMASSLPIIGCVRLMLAVGTDREIVAITAAHDIGGWVFIAAP